MSALERTILIMQEQGLASVEDLLTALKSLETTYKLDEASEELL